MISKNSLILSLLSVLLAATSVYAGSPVWKVSHNGNHLFIGGTVHVLTRSDYPLPAPFESAYDNSEILVLETDVHQLQSQDFKDIFLSMTTYQGKGTLTGHLKADTVATLETFLQERAIPLEHVNKLKPGLLAVTLTMVELQRLGQTGTGVDEFYAMRSLNTNREIMYLEPPLKQIEFIADMGVGNEDEFINHLVKDLAEIAQTLPAIKSAWREGDTDKLDKLVLKEMQEQFPNTYHSLIAQRNNNWIPQIEAMLRTRKVELVLFGALHLGGKDGILTLLKKQGYSIENM